MGWRDKSIGSWSYEDHIEHLDDLTRIARAIHQAKVEGQGWRDERTAPGECTMCGAMTSWRLERYYPGAEMSVILCEGCARILARGVVWDEFWDWVKHTRDVPEPEEGR